MKNGFAVLLPLVVAVACGEVLDPNAQTAGSEDRIAEVYWAGMGQVSSDTNATTLLRIARLPESVVLKQQMLDKLSRALWTSNGLNTNPVPRAMLQPLLDDLIKNECLLSLSGASSSPPSAVLAIRLDREHSELWETNLGRILHSLTSNNPAPMAGGQPGWRWPPEAARASKEETRDQNHAQGSRRFIQFTRAEEWTLVGASHELKFLETLVSKTLNKAESARSDTALWLEAELDLKELAQHSTALANLFVSHPSMHLQLRGEGGKISSEVRFKFQEPLGLELEPWNVPTNLISQPLASFTASRGLDGLLPILSPSMHLDLDLTPRQMFAWAIDGQMMFSYFAAQVPDPSQFMEQATVWICPNGEGWRTEDQTVGFKKSVDDDGVHWQGLPYLWPFLKSAGTNSPDFILGGAFTHTAVTEPLDHHFVASRLSSDGLICCSWEATDQRIGQWLFMGQFIRFALGRSQLPKDSNGVLWLKAIAGGLGDSETSVRLTAPDQLTISRSSSLGLTAIELHLLADWLESPKFPLGLYTQLAPPVPRK